MRWVAGFSSSGDEQCDAPTRANVDSDSEWLAARARQYLFKFACHSTPFFDDPYARHTRSTPLTHSMQNKTKHRASRSFVRCRTVVRYVVAYSRRGIS